MAIKGSATIELTNADGSKEVYKHDNMITNAVNDLCVSQRGDLATILKIVNSGDSYAKELFGGLLLFDETLNTDANDYFLPTVKCTGYASQDAYAGLDTCRGSFNASEGGVQADGSYKFVWDFATSQANGTIKSLALVPNEMGQIGLTSSRVANDAKSFSMKRVVVDPFSARMIPNNSVYDGFPASGLYIVAIIDDIAYVASIDNIGFRGGSASSDLVITNNGGILKLLRFKMGMSNISLSDRVGVANYIDTINIQLPTEFMSTIVYSAYSPLIAMNYIEESKKIIVFPCCKVNNVAVGGTLKYCEIDVLNNYAITTYTFTNNTAGTISGEIGSTGAQLNSYNFYPMKDYIFVASNISRTTRFYSVSRSNNTDVKEIKRRSGESMESGADRYFNPLFWGGAILIASIRSTGSGVFCCAIDMSTGEMRDMNISSDIYAMSVYNNFDVGNHAVFGTTYEYMQFYHVFNPFILCTKNNLDIPVTKTASQTMKITYTLSVADTAGSEV